MRILEAARNTALLVSTFSLEGELLAQNPAAFECYGDRTANEEGRAARLDGRFQDPGAAEALLRAVVADEPAQEEFEIRASAVSAQHELV